MAKLHTHYITNIQKELKYAYTDLSENAFQASVQQALFSAEADDDSDNDEDEDFFDDSDDDNEEDNSNSNTSDPKNADIEKWINIDDSELKKLLDVNVSVVIEPHPMTIDHGSTDFDIEATLNNVLGTST